MAAPYSPERRSTVERARESWIRRLIDLSRRNNLLYFRDLKVGTLDLSDHEPEAMAMALRGESVFLDRLLPRADQVSTAARAREIRRRALSNLEERGIETLYIGLGMASWPATDGGRSPESVIVLVPVIIGARGREGRTLTVRREGEVQVNLALLHILEVLHGITVSAEELLQDAGDEDEAFDPSPVYARLREATSRVQDFVVTPRAVLGNFSFQKMAMVKDLQERDAELLAHDLIAAIAGDAEARRAVSANRKDIDPRELDRRHPDHEFLFLDADSSQQRVITAVAEGQDGVVHGPPGTGKSQTIANLIATLAAMKRRVLFVAEKRAALEVVLRRLQEVGLGHVALDLHGAAVTRREVMKHINESIAVIRQAVAVDSTSLHRRFVSQRKKLNEHVARLHCARSPSGLSVYQLQGKLLRLPHEARAKTRWRGQDLDQLGQENVEAVKELLVEASGFEGLFLCDHPSPWTGANLRDGNAVQQAMDLATRVARVQLPALLSSLEALVSATWLTPPQTLNEAAALVGLLTEVSTTLTLYDREIFGQDLEALIRALAPASRGLLSVAMAWCSKPDFRQARRTLLMRRHARAVSAKKLLAEASTAASQLRRWQALSSRQSVPYEASGVEAARGHLKELLMDLDLVGAYLGRHDLNEIQLGDLAQLFNALASDAITPSRLPRLLEIERKIAQLGAGAIIPEIRASKPEPDYWPQAFEYAWLASCLDSARATDPALAGFNGRAHDKFVEDFRCLDKQRIKLAIDRVRRTHAEHVIEVMNAHPEQNALVRREAEKRSRHLPLRSLLSQAPNVLTALCPCWMASPLSVSQLLSADRRYFDVVIFDEASQVLPEDAVPALLRASQAVVAGDELQLPPTLFFSAGEDEEDEELTPAPTAGFESILSVMSAFLGQWPLMWHYRSKDEALIAFSNRHIYSNRLTTFPGPGGLPPITHVLVPQVMGRDGEEESSSSEVQRVVELVLDHATKRPKETLGAIAMGIRHANRVYAAIEEARLLRPDLDEFFDQNRHERFFVKNLERVQGDEREAIILTVGYGKDRSGKLPYRFGPLLMEGGERRLNVAVTRARRRMTLVSSFNDHDMDPARSTKRGVELLRLYLQYAASNGRNLGDTGETGIPLNEFEADVFDTLTGKGVALLPQWGASQYRIDLVARHPERPGRFVLAIECDGATYHSTPTARERDRLRQQHLEALDWRFHRIWSTDWFVRREEEITRALSAYQAAVRYANQADADSDEGGIANRPASNPTSSNSGSSREATSALLRGPKPKIRRGENITDYHQKDLEELLNWIKSDGQLRPDEELVQEMVRELGFQRRGPRIVSTLRLVIESARSRKRQHAGPGLEIRTIERSNHG
ncbi:MAG: AAA domain-containing protein [Nitrospirales bacterium]